MENIDGSDILMISGRIGAVPMRSSRDSLIVFSLLMRSIITYIDAIKKPIMNCYDGDQDLYLGKNDR